MHKQPTSMCKGVDLTFMQLPAETEQAAAAVSDTAADSVRISDL